MGGSKGATCSIGDALGVLEICPGWHFAISGRVYLSSWKPHRCSEAEIDAIYATDLHFI